MAMRNVGDPRRRAAWLATLCFAVNIVASGAACAESTLPPGLALVGLVDKEWRLFVAESGTLRHVATSSEPRTPTYSASFARVAYIGAEGALREIDLRTGSDVLLLQPSKSVAYTQPAYRPKSDELYVVALRDGSSVETDIGRVDRGSRRIQVVLQQRSAQFEPAFTRDGARMFYSNVACASECPKVIQEIWTMDMVGGISEQVSLFNGVARQPVSDGHGGVVFASNKAGIYQLWRVGPNGTDMQQLTKDRTIDESPVVSDSGEIYFIRRAPGGGRLMSMNRAGKVSVVSLAASIQDVRDLRWGL